jgi:hypothetical protein
MSGFMALAPMGVSAAASAGDLIKMDGLSSVYYLGEDGKRYVFPNESTYFSWYSDFSGVVTIPASELQSYPLGGNVTMRPGTTLVKITTDPSVYAVEPNGVLRKIANESQAAALYGTNWNKRIVDLADAFFTNYTIGQPLADGEVPVGSLVKNADSASVYYYDGTNYRMIASEAAMTANRFSFSNVMTISNDITAGGTAITGMEAGLVKTSQGATGPGQVVTGSGLMVSLNSQTPASMNIPGGSSVEFLKLNLTAASDGAVNVSSIKLTAYGLSDGQNIDDVTFYDNGMKVGTSKDVNSDRVATFNFATPIYVAAGSTKTLTVKATVAVNTGSYGLGIASASDIIATSASVTGSFPVVGNTMSAVAGSLGGVTIEDIDVSNSVNFGEDDVLLADFTLETTSQENVLLQSISLYNGGTNSDDIMSNLRMYIDGEEVATGSYVDRYATFSLDGYEIEKSTNVSVEVRGDMGITSDGDTVKLYLKDNIDFVAVGKTHGFSVSLTNDFDAIYTVITLNTGDFTIDMDKSATPAKDVKPDTKDVELATLTFKSNGENATITGIAGSGFYVVTDSGTSTVLLENAELYDVATGGIYDLAVATSSTATHQELTLSDEISLAKGVAKTFKVRADIRDIVPENTTFYVELNGTAMTIEGDVSGADIDDITPSSVAGSIITVEDASLTLTPITLTDVNVVGGATNVVVYQGKLKAGTADGVKVLSVKLTAATSSTSTLAFTNSNVSKLTLWLNGKELKYASNQINETTDTITFSSLDSANYTIPAGMEYDLVVTADFSSSLTAGDFDLSIDAAGDISARSVVGNNVVTPSVTATDSREVTAVEKGTLTVELVTTDAKANRDSFLLAGSETEAGRYLGEIKFTTANEDIKVQKLTLTEGLDATNADLSSVKLVKADGTVVATETVEADGDVVFDPFDVVFEKDQTTSLFIVAVAKGLNVSGDPTATATSGRTAQYTLSTTTAIGNESGSTITVTNSAGTSKTATIVGSKLNSVVNAMTDGQLTGGLAKTIGKYTLTFDNGANRNTSDNTELKAVLTELVVTMSTSSAVSLANVKLHIDGTSDKVSATSFTGGVATWATSTLASLTDSAKMDGSVTLVVSADVTTTAADGEYVQTSIADLDGESDIHYTSNGVLHNSMYLPVIEVVGGTLSE